VSKESLKDQEQTKSMENTILEPSVTHDNEVDLHDLARAVWKGKWLIICITAIFSVASVFYALSLPDEYKATAILSPASSSSSSSLSKLAGQFGGLASLAGVNLKGSDGANKTTIAIKLMKTWGFLERFIQSNNLQVPLYAAVDWDKGSNELLLDTDIYDVQEKVWFKDQTLQGPSSWALYEKLNKMIDIVQDSDSGLIYLSVVNFSPHLAKEWVDLLIVETNDFMKSQDRKEALSSIEYLKVQIAKTNISEMNTIFYQLIEEQTKTLMLAEISEEYVFRTLSPARVAELKSGPKRGLIVTLAASFGAALALVFCLIFNLPSSRKKVESL
tara:strand:+ start:327 stop:1316 length:990 start_codon:yes stop_codon:yes gene_type:complete